MDKTPLAPGQLENIVRETFRRSGIEEIGPSTPAALLVTIAKWDGLLNKQELGVLKMVVRQLTPLQLEGFDDR